ncbi:hypothetical protein JCGZ_16341 [Jatropha curcas]|uniref:Uncharacterized protein n=1 Tax=Jatropha curcas TaxID=180498 RepID=A0A067LB88_JATCU|nr:hypothetical protein JCGZ_16341 [Jatropha curcas]
MDLDFIDKPFAHGSWLRTTDKVNFLESDPFISSVQYLDSYHQFSQKEMENLFDNPTPVYPGIGKCVVETDTCLGQSQGGESRTRKCLIEPYCSVKDRLMLAIDYLKEYVEDSDALIQIWVPTKIAGQNVLTTTDQPYSLNPSCLSLASYRNVSKAFHLTAEEDSKESAGLPGPVFLEKFPEWTPDVRFFRNDECPRKYYAELYNISGCLALPVFEQESGTCLAVVEIVTTTQKINYHLELEIVCKALEAVDLKSSQDFFPFCIKTCNEFYQIAIPEISKILKSVCETNNLPLALTWALCNRQGKNEYKQVSGKYDYYISTVDSACYMADSDLFGFYKACSTQYLFLDQGIVGKALTRNKQLFATDVTSFSKTSYPLSHHARMFNLRAALAIPLANIYTGSIEFVLEIFLPRDCQDIEEQKHMWDFLPIVIQHSCRNFHVIMDKEKENFAFVSWECLKEEPEEAFKVISHWDNNESEFSEFEQLQESSALKFGVTDESKENSSVGEKRQTKAEKTISLQILRQYFAGSLKDAAKSIGVCPTTLKRICRQHGINRWPSRKIKKGNHSLKKLQLVVNSIRGAEGLIRIDSFYNTFPGLNSQGNDHFPSFKTNNNSQKLNSQPDSGLLSLKVADSNSQSPSGSQNSGSSICCSTKAKQLTSTTTNGLNTAFSLAVEVPVVTLNRSCSKAELLSPNHDKIQETIPKVTGQSFRDGMIFRVKATFGLENIRFSFQPNWAFKDLQQEIAKRFKIYDFSKIDLKYLDIDQESVLLTCDDDLDECLDLLRFSQTNTLKISLYQSSQPKI